MERKKYQEKSEIFDGHNIKTSILPFKLVHNNESQLLLTNRKKTSIRFPNDYLKKSHSIETKSKKSDNSFLTPKKSEKLHKRKIVAQNNLFTPRSIHINSSQDNIPIPFEDIIKTSPSKILDSSIILSQSTRNNVELLNNLNWKKSLPRLSQKKIFTSIKQDDKFKLLDFSRTKSQLLRQSMSNLSLDSIDNKFDNEFYHKKEKETVITGYWTLKKLKGLTPNSRESSQMVYSNNKVYIFGGQSKYKENDIIEIDLTTWNSKILNVQHKPNGISGHSMVIYKQKIITFGGTFSHSENLGIRRCTNRIHVLSQKDYNWQLYPKIGDWPRQRRHHAASSIGRTMIIYGGIGQDGQLLSDLRIFDMKQKEWTHFDMLQIDDPGGLSHLSLTAIFPDIYKENYNFTFIDLYKNFHTLEIKNCGFYLFGGLSYENKVSNRIYKLCVSLDFKLYFKEINAQGNIPLARCAHTACSIKQRIFIFGGRNDSIHKETGNSCLNSLCVFNVETLIWEKLELYGNLPEGRWGHCSISFNTKILIIGGMSNKKFMTGDLYRLETDKDIVEEEINKEKLLDITRNVSFFDKSFK